MAKKTIKAKIEDWKHSRGKRLLKEQNININDFLAGYWADLLENQADEEYAEAKRGLVKYQEERDRLEQREQMILERIEELRREVSDVRTERENVEDEIEELKQHLSTPDTSDDGEDEVVDGDMSSYDDRIEQILIEFVNDKGSEKGITEADKRVQRVSQRSGMSVTEVIEELREKAKPAADHSSLQYVDDPVQRAIRFRDNEQYDSYTLDRIRRAIALEVFGQGDDRIDADVFEDESITV